LDVGIEKIAHRMSASVGAANLLRKTEHDHERYLHSALANDILETRTKALTVYPLSENPPHLAQWSDQNADWDLASSL
jgi:hypothetical protein